MNGTIHLPSMQDVEIRPGVLLLEEPVPVAGTNTLRCLAYVGGALAIVELSVKFKEQP